MVISVLAQKGGAGKTTLATCLAAELLARGKRILGIDADPQQTLLTWAAVAAEADRPVATVVAMAGQMHRPGQLDKVASGFDVTIVDGPPRHSEIVRSAILASDVVLVPTGPAPGDVWSLTSTIDLVVEAQKVKPSLRAAIVLTKTMPRTVLGASARAALSKTGLPLLKSELTYRIAYQEALGAGMGASTYAPTSPAAEEVRALVDEVLSLTKRKKETKRAA